MINPEMTYQSLKKLAKDDQPREKLLEKGRTSLSNAELMAILISSGTIEKSAVQLSREVLLAVDNDLNKLARLTEHDLMRFKGIGIAKAVAISAALELGRRKQQLAKHDLPKISCSKDIYNFVKAKVEDLNHEEFYIVLFNRANQVKSVELISKGGFSGTVVDGKLIFKKALEQSACSLALFHNHPSGNCRPSSEDIILTKKMVKFGNLIGLPILDHLIITDTTYFSFSDENLI